MSEEGRPRRGIQRVDYAEPGDNPDESALEPSDVASVNTSYVSVEGEESFASVESRTTVASVGESIGEPLLGSSPKSAAAFVEDEARDMASARANQLIAELEAVFFQLGEIKEDVDGGIDTMSGTELSGCVADLKNLRVELVKAHQELNLLSKKREYDDRVNQELAESKLVLNTLKGRLSGLECMKDKADEARQQQAAAVERLRNDSKVAAFKRSSKEINTMYVNLNQTYTAPSAMLTRDQMLKRHADVPALASEFDSFRERVDRLINQTDLLFPEKEQMIDDAVDLLAKLETSKLAYEKKAYDDLVANDLTEQKRKLAESIQIDVGKFSGVLGVGDDYYTFKSKFLKAYTDYPQSLLVQCLKNNHLQGRAKDSVGSLDAMESIWLRLESNFGNTTEMLMHHFQQINKMGHMNKQKTYTQKKHYLQALINSMQDAIDVATDHGLTGEVHHGPQLKKIVTLLENYLQTAWYRIVTIESLSQPNRWLRMIVFLEAELQIIQTRANETESASSDVAGEGVSRKEDTKDSSRDKRNSTNNNNIDRCKIKPDKVNVTRGEACNLCDDTHNNANKEFLQCKKFLEMTPKQRCSLVFSKKKCMQCLSGSAKWNDKDHVKNCSSKWICQNDHHQKFERKLHFLICEAHHNEAENLALYDCFKSECLKAEWQLRVMKKISGYFVRSSGFKVKKKKRKKKALCNVAVSDDPSDDICPDFAAQIEGSCPDSEEICVDFLSQMKDDGLTSTESHPDHAVQVVNVVCSSEVVDASSIPTGADRTCFVDLDSCPSDEIHPDFAAQMTGAYLAEDEDMCADFAAQISEQEVTTETIHEPVTSVELSVLPEEAVAVETVHCTPERSLTTIKDVVDADIRAKIELTANTYDVIPDVRKGSGTPVFLLQPVPFNERVFNLMFDSGCEGFVSRKGAVDLLPDSCKKNIWPGPISLSGVGGCEVVSLHGHYEVKLPIFDGRLATFSGLCLDTVTGMMPPYPVREARKTVVEAYLAAGGKEADLPNVPALVGGETDFLIGMAYNWFLPQRLFVLPSGLAIYRSVFVGVDGSRGCIGGNHELFAQCERQFVEVNGGSVVEFHAFLRQRIELFNNGLKVCLDYNSLSVIYNAQDVKIAVINEEEVLPTPRVLLTTRKNVAKQGDAVADYRCPKCLGCSNCHVLLSTRTKLLGSEADAAGTVLDYRCPKCRACSACKGGERLEAVSMKSEEEQFKIDASVGIDFARGITDALLPFMEDPEEKLVPNRDIALKVYKQQTRKLSKDPAAKEAVLKSEDKLHQAGHVDWVANLAPEMIKMLNDLPTRYYMPWRYVVNENSISTPVRVVFDASSATASGFSMNDILAKGINSLNSMLEIWVRFRLVVVAIHTDIKMMYNVIKLKPEHWTYQRYLWGNELDPDEMPKDKLCKTLIYGVKSSGNQAQCGLRMTAKAQEDQYPSAARAIIEDTYVDDCATGADSVREAEDLASDIVALLGATGFKVKGFGIAGQPPPLALTKDGESLSVFGNKWLPEKDEISLSIGPLNFAKKYRGKRGVCDGEVPEILTKNICLGKVHELFDLCGLVAPIMCTFKLDLRELFEAYEGWHSPISAEERLKWIKHFDLLVSIGEIKFSRVVIPVNATSLKMELLGAGDASAQMTCAACYVRFPLVDGQYSCQLIMAKTKIVPKGMTLPRAELLAAVLNIYICQVVKRAMKDRVVRQVYVTDSEIALYWMNNDTKQLKPWTRNRVIEANRFSQPAERFHVASEMNPADLGTRPGATIEDVSPDSEWQCGKSWMKLPFDEMRKTHLNSVSDIRYRKEQLAEIRKESSVACPDLSSSGFLVVAQPMKCASHKCFLLDKRSDTFVQQISKKVKERLEFSQYIVDPNRFNFSKVVRVIALVIKAVKMLLERWKNTRQLKHFSHVVADDDSIHSNHSIFEKINLKHDPSALQDNELQYGLDYLFQKTTEEVKKFSNPKLYEKNSYERNGVLYYSSRVNPGNLSFVGKMTDAMIDLSSGSFDVPIVDHFSPVAFSVVNQIHWYHPTAKHSGVESTIRFVMNVAHILGMRELVKAFRRQCTRCRYLLKRTIEVPMGPVSKHQLSVAPPFYVTQCDICGPFFAYSKHNRRTLLKIWLITFVCVTTGMTSLKTMEGFDTTQFLLSFSRFSSDAGFPKLLLIDEGSQLVRGCEKMSINMSNAQGVLRTECGVTFQTCPVGGHNFHGKAERKIKAVQETIEKSIPPKARLSTIEWETWCSTVANTINNLPVAIGNETEDLECIDLITPNRLKLGRNNERSPVGPVDITDKFDRIIEQNTNIYNTWWEAWLTSAVPKLVPQPKWFTNDGGIRVGDVVIFKKAESALSGQYQYGIVSEVKHSSDNVIRAVVLRYRNASEHIDRFTTRSVRSIVVIHRIDELNIMEELGNAALLGKEVVNIASFCR